jgi:hypothetical protein
MNLIAKKTVATIMKKREKNPAQTNQQSDGHIVIDKHIV